MKYPTFSIDDQYQLSIIEGGDGEYVEVKVEELDHHFAPHAQIFSGYDGEENLTIFIMTLQSGEIDIFIVRSGVDDYHKFNNLTFTCHDNEIIARNINMMVIKLLNKE